MLVSTLDVTVFPIIDGDDDAAAFGPQSCVVVFTYNIIPFFFVRYLHDDANDNNNNNNIYLHDRSFSGAPRYMYRYLQQLQYLHYIIIIIYSVARSGYVTYILVGIEVYTCSAADENATGLIKYTDIIDRKTIRHKHIL